jgi:hypothetical protein
VTSIAFDRAFQTRRRTKRRISVSLRIARSDHRTRRTIRCTTTVHGALAGTRRR